jgi:LEA14-like dessication related protein
LEKKILVYVAVGVLVAITASIAAYPRLGLTSSTTPVSINPINIEYNGTSIVSVSDTNATLLTAFYVTNPNNTTLILERITYNIYENGVMIVHGDIGQTYEGSVEASNYFTLVDNGWSNISAKDVIQNTGNNPDEWAALQNGTAKLTVSGTVFYSIKTAITGQDFSKDFNFTKS